MEKKEKNRNSYSELPEGEESSIAKVSKKEPRKSKENREIRLLKKSKSVKVSEKKNPDRFNGEGITFRAKIIGIEDVFDARGNRMCQGALQKLKAAVKTSGDHKQRIKLNISLDGIIIKDEKSGEILHHHPIHKISCISQDSKDNRAFGFVYGCPQTGHRFFAIKTEKTASQVVLTLRDLFLVALEMKKKEIEKTVQKEDGEQDKIEKEKENGHAMAVDVVCSTSASDLFPSECEKLEIPSINHDFLYSNTVLLPEEVAIPPPPPPKTEPHFPAFEVTNNTLQGLQSEVSILQQGISQMDQSIAHTASQSLGVSLSEDEVSESSTSSFPTSFQFKLDKLSSVYHETMSISSRSSTSDYNVCVSESKQESSDSPQKHPFRNSASLTSEGCASAVSSLSVGGSSSETSNTDSATASTIEDKYAVFLDIDSLPSIFDNPGILETSKEKPAEVLHAMQNCSYETEDTEVKSSTVAAFAELDPLGNQPYVDKRDFFQDIKYPPKKILKDLVGTNVLGSSDSEALSSSCECLTFSDLKLNHPEGSSVSEGILTNPPELPPKRFIGSPYASEFLQECNSSSSDIWEFKNPFNPFLGEDYSDMPPPNSPPPPPPPRLLTNSKKTFESSPIMSPPPPRPPSRMNGVPTPPLPKRKVPLSSVNRTWFSFDQDAVPLPADDSDVGANYVAPPLPSPARKCPSHKPESPLLKSSSASNSPATMRRLYNKSSYLSNAVVIKENSDAYYPYLENGEKESKTTIMTSSPCRVLLRHSSVIQNGDTVSGATFNPFLEICDSGALPESHKESCSPPLPPKPKPPSVEKVSSVPCAFSFSSSMSITESSNGTHSSSSLVFSSVDDKISSSTEALFTSSTSSQPDVFTQSSQVIQPQSSNDVSREKSVDPDLSPDSIFRRKSDPFADDFFLSLHKKTNGDTQSITKNVEPFDNLKAPT